MNLPDRLAPVAIPLALVLIVAGCGFLATAPLHHPTAMQSSVVFGALVLLRIAVTVYE